MSDLGNKEIMSENIKFYMDKHGKTRKDICDALGFKYTTFTDWIKGNTYPRIDKIEMLARYFGISKADLVEEHLSAPTSYYDDPRVAELAQFAFDHPEYGILFDASKKVRPEDIEQVLRIIKTFTEE